MADAQVAYRFAQAVRRRRKEILGSPTLPFSSIPLLAGPIILDNGKSNRDGGSTTSPSQTSLAAATSTTSIQPNWQTIQAFLTFPSSTPFTNAVSLSQTSPVVYTPEDTSPPVPSPSPTTILMSSTLALSPVKINSEVPTRLSQIISETFTPPDIVFTTTTLSPFRSTSIVVATATATQGDLPVTILTSTKALVHPITITTIVPSSGTNSQLSTTIATLTTDSARSTARGAGKAITNAGSGTAALPSGLPSSNPEYGLKVSHNPPLIIGLVLGSILLLSACAAGAGWILRARRRWKDHRIAALGVDTRTSFGNASTLFVPDPTWYREDSKESDDATQHGGGIDTRRAAKESFIDSSAPQKPANTHLCSYDYPSAMKYAYIPDPPQNNHPIPISVGLSQTRSRNAPLPLSLVPSATARFSRRGTFATSSRLPTPAFGERNRGELSGRWMESIMRPAYQASTVGFEYVVDPTPTSGPQDPERTTESTSLAAVGTVDQNYERGRRSPLRIVGQLTGDVTADGLGNDAGTSTGSRVEEKLKRMREKRNELERV